MLLKSLYMNGLIKLKTLIQKKKPFSKKGKRFDLQPDAKKNFINAVVTMLNHLNLACRLPKQNFGIQF